MNPKRKRWLDKFRRTTLIKIQRTIMNLIDFIPPKRYTNNQQPEAIGIIIKKINEMIAVINQLNSSKETLDRKNLI